MTDGTEYTFTAKSVDAAGNQSADSTGVQATANSNPPGAVVLAATALANASIEVTWTDPSDADFSHILLAWAPIGGTEAQPLNIPSGMQSTTITGLTDGTEYTFTAKSVDTVGNQSADSAAVQATADSTPPGVVVLTASVQANGSVEVTWTDPSDADFSHILLAWTSVGGTAAPPLTIPSGQANCYYSRFNRWHRIYVHRQKC